MITDVRVQRPSESELELAIHALHGVLEALDWIDSVKIGVSEERLNDGRANLLIAGRLITETCGGGYDNEGHTVPGLRGVSDVVVTTDEFAPLYRRGDVVFLDSSVALTPGDECVFCARNGDVKIARLLRVEAGCWVVRGYSAATEERLSRKEWPEGAFVDAGYVGRHWTRESARQAYKVHWHAEHAAAAEA